MKALLTGKSIAICALAVLTGVMALQSLRSLPDALWLQYLPLALLVALFSARGRLPALFISGVLWALWHAHLHFHHVLPESRSGSDIRVSGVVQDIPLNQRDVLRFELAVTAGDLAGRRLRLNWYFPDQLPRAGEHWRLKVRLKPPHGSLNPGGDDYEMRLYQRGIHATGYVRDDRHNRRLAVASAVSIDGLRQVIVEHLRAANFHYPGLLAALTVGYSGDIESAQWDTMLRTGTNHLMAISGSHVSLVAGLVYWLALRLVPIFWLRAHAAQPVAAMVALAVAGFYALLAGFSVPTQRALIMLAVVLGAIMLRRPLQAANTLGAALLAVLLFDPLASLSVGFWFSFLAVMVIFYAQSARLHRGGWWWRWGRLQWLITLALFPLSLFLFQQTSLVSPLANLFMVPWITLVVVPLLLLGVVLLALLPMLADVLFRLADFSLHMVWPGLEYLGNVPLALWVRPEPDIVSMLLALLGVALLMAPRGMPQRWLGAVMVLPVIVVQPDVPPPQTFRATLIDVGQGLAVFVQTHGHNLLFDTGAKFSEDSDAGERMVLPYLRHQGVGVLHRLVISHGDSDHRGGAQSVLDNLEVLELVGQDIEELSHARKLACAAGQSWNWDGVEFRFLHPDRYEKKSNNRGCVLRVDNGAESLLIAADIEANIEQRLLRTQGEYLAADVLVVPHHGSKTSSSAAWVAAVQPHYALIAAGYRNRFGHPRTEVVERYRQAGSQVLNTAGEGAITLHFDQQPGLVPQSWRQMSRRYWNAPYSH